MSRFPLQEKPFTGGMVISLPGVLDRVSAHCQRSRDNKYLVAPLEHLQKCINHLRESQSDEQALERLEAFLRLWVKS